jgi:hypothetical protein
MAYKCKGIGKWNSIISFIIFLSVFSNYCILFFSNSAINNPLLKFFCAEHLLFAVMFLIRKLFKENKENWPNIYLKRLDYYK